MPELHYPFSQEYPITQGFKSSHNALDFGCPEGTLVLLDVEGKITRADFHVNQNGTPGYGNHVQVLHPDGSLSLYAHLSEFNCKVGQNRQSGDVIGYSGNTGNSTGPHLHYEFRPDAVNGIDPSTYFLALDDGTPPVEEEPDYQAEIQPGDRIALDDSQWSYVNLRPVASAAAGVPDLGDLTPGIELPVIQVDGEWIQAGIWINARYLKKVT